MSRFFAKRMNVVVLAVTFACVPLALCVSIEYWIVLLAGALVLEREARAAWQQTNRSPGAFELPEAASGSSVA